MSRIGIYCLSLIILQHAVPEKSRAQELDHTRILKQQKDTAYINRMLYLADSLILPSGILPDTGAYLFNEALNASRSIGYAYGISRSLLGLAAYEAKKGAYTHALNLLDLSEKHNIGSEEKNIKMLLLIQAQRGVLYNQMGMYETAIEYYINMLPLLKETDSFRRQETADVTTSITLGGAYSNLGQLYQTIGNFPKAEWYLNQAEKKAIGDKDSMLLATVYINKGSLQFSMQTKSNNGRDHVYYTKQALEIAEKNNYPGIQKNALSNLAGFVLINETEPDFRQALQYLKEARALPGRSVYNEVYIISNLAGCYIGLKEFSLAKKALDTAIILAEQSGSKELRMTIHNRLSYYYKQVDDYKQALHHSEAAADIKDSIVNDKISEKIHQVQYQYETTRKDNELIKRQLQIVRQQAIIQRKNTLAGALVTGGIILGAFSWIYYRYRRKLQIREEQRNMEVAAWRASLEGEEKERKRLAHQLHDHIGGSLSTVKMWFGNIRSRLNGQLGDQEKEYQDALQLLDNTLMEVRNTAHHLMPELLLRLGLAEAIRVFCANMQKASGIHIRYHYFGYIGVLDKSLELIIYRTVQELVQNVTKHAQATQALVQLSQHEGLLSITVEDNGIGMNTGEQERKNGIGLQSILNSIEKLGGQFRMQSEPGNGTTVDIEICTEKTMPEKNETTI